MHPDLKRNLKCLTFVNYVVTEEEDRIINAIANSFVKRVSTQTPTGAEAEEGASKITGRPRKKKDDREPPSVSVKVYNSAFGLIPVEHFQTNLKTKALPRADENFANAVKAMESVYLEDTTNQVHYYIILDPDRYLENPDFVRRILNIIHQVNADLCTVKCIYFVGPVLVVPPKLASYMHIVRDDHLSDEEISDVLGTLHERVQGALPPDAHTWFRGLTAHQVKRAASQAIITSKDDPDPERRSLITKEGVFQYKRDRIRKTDLLQTIDTSKVTFDQLGGTDRFKAWAEKARNSWTPAGKAYGLRPPKGVMCVGVWGCGKSLSVKALGNAWKVPCIQLELGKLRDSGVGNTEANTYRVIKHLEAMAPCLVWVDEAEKSFSGLHSSSHSDAGTTARGLGILSTWHQETEADICLALTANNLRTLPVEFTSRLNERFFFDLPSEDVRIEILKILLVSVGHLSKEQIAEFNLRQLAETSENMVPREMHQSIEAALLQSFVEHRPCLDFDILDRELRTKPRIVKTMEAEIREVVDWVGFDEVSQDGLRARYASTKQDRNRTLKILEGGLK